MLLEVSLLHLAYPALSSLSQKQTSNSVPHHKMPDFVCHGGKKKKKSVKSSHPSGIHSSLLVLVFCSNFFSPMFNTRPLTFLDSGADFDLGKMRNQTNLQPPFFQDLLTRVENVISEQLVF